MGFRPIFVKTFVDLTGIKGTSLMVSLATLAAVGLLYISADERHGGNWSAQMLTLYVTDRYLMISYFWLSGFFIAFLVAASAAVMIAKEESDGTLSILASKPIDRRAIVLGKLGALIIRTVLLEAVLLILLALITRFTLGVGDDTLLALLRAALWVLLYSLIPIVFFAAVSVLLSTLSKNLVVIMAVMSVLIMLAFLLGPLIRYLMPSDGGIYVRSHLYCVDPSYHLQNAFVPFWRQASGGEIVPQLAEWFGSKAIVQQPEFDGITYHAVQTVSHIGPGVSIAGLIATAVAAVCVALWAIERKEIH